MLTTQSFLRETPMLDIVLDAKAGRWMLDAVN